MPYLKSFLLSGLKIIVEGFGYIKNQHYICVHKHVHLLKTGTMAILKVTSTDFRKDTKSYFDAASQGQQVIIKRGKQSFTLVPIDEDDLYFTPEMLDKINQSIEQVKKGDSITVSSIDELKQLVETHGI